jgi:excinuclease UvrABC nuclease subunit
MLVGKPPVDSPVFQALPESLSWARRPQAGDFAALPGCPAVYLLLSEGRQPVQLATTQHLRRLARARLVTPAPLSSGRADLAEIVREIRWRPVGSAFEGHWWYYRLAREMYPKQYRTLISFGPAYFLNVAWEARVPEIQVTERVWQETGECVGPWLTHDTCEKALAGLCDLFDLCRFPEQVRRAPGGQRCAYADMGRCDAPCDGSVPLERYVERCRAAWAFACGGVRAWIDEAKQRMKLAAAEQRFEAAAQIKQQLAFAWKWHDRWSPLVRPAAELNYSLAVPVTRRRACKLFLFRQGHLSEGPVLNDRQLPDQGAAWLREEWVRILEPVDPPVRMEQTWLVAHFLKSKEGDVSFAKPLSTGGLPSGLEDDLRQWCAGRRSARRTAETAGPPVRSEHPPDAPSESSQATEKPE